MQRPIAIREITFWKLIFDNFIEFKEKDKTNKRQEQQNQKGQIETVKGIDKVREIEQMRLSAFFRD